jgi:hypothetical protein
LPMIGKAHPSIRNLPNRSDYESEIPTVECHRPAVVRAVGKRNEFRRDKAGMAKLVESSGFQEPANILHQAEQVIRVAG